MKAFKEPIDYDGLEGELHEALRADELYNLQNDAKFRAVEQSVPTYEDFRQMVNAAHLKPLDRDDMRPKIGVKWNCIANDKTSSQSEHQLMKKRLDRQSSLQFSTDTLPMNSHEFRQAWKRLVDHNDRFRLLNESRHALSNEIFRSEIPPDILTDCLVTCLESLKSIDNENLVIDILSTLSECKRFKLAVDFMSAEDKSVCKELFRALRRTAITKNERIVSNLEEKYFL